jgi:hypothetical protein
MDKRWISRVAPLGEEKAESGNEKDGRAHIRDNYILDTPVRLAKISSGESLPGQRL